MKHNLLEINETHILFEFISTLTLFLKNCLIPKKSIFIQLK